MGKIVGRYENSTVFAGTAKLESADWNFLQLRGFTWQGNDPINTKSFCHEECFPTNGQSITKAISFKRKGDSLDCLVNNWYWLEPYIWRGNCYKASALTAWFDLAKVTSHTLKPEALCCSESKKRVGLLHIQQYYKLCSIKDLSSTSWWKSASILESPKFVLR
jgi:hypothetical protein